MHFKAKTKVCYAMLWCFYLKMYKLLELRLHLTGESVALCMWIISVSLQVNRFDVTSSMSNRLFFSLKQISPRQCS